MNSENIKLARYVVVVAAGIVLAVAGIMLLHGWIDQGQKAVLAQWTMEDLSLIPLAMFIVLSAIAIWLTRVLRR